MRKAIETVNDLDNVLFEISNESTAESKGWQYHMIHYIHDYEAREPKRHPVLMSIFVSGGNNSDLFASPAEAIAPRSEPGEDYRDAPPAADGSKVIISDTDHLWGLGGKSRKWVWKSFCRGINPIYMDSMTRQEEVTRIVKQEFDPRREPIRLAMGYARACADKMDFIAMVPRNDLASTGYCLASPGREYLAYLPSGGAVTIDLSEASGAFSVEWFNPRTSATTQGGTARGGARRSFTAPFAGDAVIYLKAEGGVVGAN